MALNIFKKKEKEKREKPSRALAVEGKERKEEKPVEAKTQKEKKIGLAWQILKTPHVTEKATDLAEKNQYIFNIYRKANKSQVKRAVEDIYGVDAISVNIINVPRKKRRLGRIQGWKEGYKKAVVKIREGQKIEVMPR